MSLEKLKYISSFSKKILWLLFFMGALFLQPGSVFAQIASICIDSGDGGDLITSDVANPMDVGTIAPVVTNPYSTWLPVCGNSQFISDNSSSKVTPPASVGTNQFVITRTLTLTAAQLAVATFNISAKADDAITIIVNGNSQSCIELRRRTQWFLFSKRLYYLVRPQQHISQPICGWRQYYNDRDTRHLWYLHRGGL